MKILHFGKLEQRHDVMDRCSCYDKNTLGEDFFVQKCLTIIPKAFENYLDNLLLVGVNYDKNTKVHECVIEKFQE